MEGLGDALLPQRLGKVGGRPAGLSTGWGGEGSEVGRVVGCAQGHVEVAGEGGDLGYVNEVGPVGDAAATS